MGMISIADVRSEEPEVLSAAMLTVAIKRAITYIDREDPDTAKYELSGALESYAIWLSARDDFSDPEVERERDAIAQELTADLELPADWLTWEPYGGRSFWRAEVRSVGDQTGEPAAFGGGSSITAAITELRYGISHRAERASAAPSQDAPRIIEAADSQPYRPALARALQGRRRLARSDGSSNRA